MTAMNLNVDEFTQELLSEWLSKIKEPDDIVSIWHNTIIGFHVVLSAKRVNEVYDEYSRVKDFDVIDCIEFYIESWNGGINYNERVATRIAEVATVSELFDENAVYEDIRQIAADEIAMCLHESARRRAWITNVNWGETTEPVKASIERYRTKYEDVAND